MMTIDRQAWERAKRRRAIRHSLAIAYLIALGLWVTYDLVFAHRDGGGLAVTVSRLPH